MLGPKQVITSTVRVQSVAFTGIQAVPVEVEIQKTRGLFGKISVVGLPCGAVRESKDRVKAAITASGIEFPRSALVINLAPADLRKEGPLYDLPFALGILAAAGIIPADALEGYLVLGELALDGRIKPVAGCLAAAITARERACKGIVVAAGNSREARLVQGIEVQSASHLLHAVSFFGGPAGLAEAFEREAPVTFAPDGAKADDSFGDLSLDYRDVTGQEMAKTALTVAAAGGHNLLMIGPPGCGKTMLARRFPSILPPLNPADSIEASKVHSIAGKGLKKLIERPPFRAPHHTVSYAGLVGGGAPLRPGEISLAHKGVLFLDELPEFTRRSLEALRQPIEEGSITLVRAAASMTLPARILLLASMNPCPCGYRGDERNRCTCTPHQALVYLRRISGPLLDRLDIQIEIPALSMEQLRSAETGISSRKMAEAVSQARERQVARNPGKEQCLNACMTPDETRRACSLTSRAEVFLDRCLRTYPFSARGYHRIMKVARTAADLDGTGRIHRRHMERAVMLRALDRLRTTAEA